MSDLADILAGIPPAATDPLALYVDRREPIRIPSTPQTGWSPVDMLAVRAGMLGQEGDPSSVVDYSNLSNIDIGQLLATQAGGRAPEPDDLPADAGFMKSLVSGATVEALGMRPLEGVDEYRAQHPYAGATSELLGLVPGYMAGIGVASTAARAIPRFGPKFSAVVAGLGKSAAESGIAANVASGFARGALREGVQLLPFEAARIATALTFEDREWAKNIAAQSAVNLGLAGAIGGAFRWFKESRPGRTVVRRGEEQLGQILSRWNTSDPAQDKIGRLRVFRETDTFQGLPDADKNAVEDALHAFEKEIELEWPSGTSTRGGQEYSKQLGRYIPTGQPVSKLRFSRGDNAVVSDLFKRKQGEAARGGTFTSYKIEDLQKGNYPGATEELTGHLLTRAGLPDGWQAVTQFPTFIKPRDAGKVAKTIRDNFMPAGNHWFLNRELGDDGLWVMARKIRGGAAPSDSDWWMVLKTNNPRALHPAGDQSLSALERTAFAMQEQPRVYGEELTGRVEDPTQPGTMLPGTGIGLARDMKSAIDAFLSPEATLTSGDLAMSDKRVLRLLPQELVDDIASGLATSKIYAKRILAPSTARSSSLTERRAMQLARATYSMAHKRVVDKTAGRLPRGARAPQEGTLLRQMKVDREGGVWDLAEDMARRNTDARPTLAQFTAAIDTDILPIEAARRGYDRSVIRTLEKLREHRLDTDREFILAGKVYDIAGQEPRFKNAYYHIAKAWRGQLRLPIFVKEGNKLDRSRLIDVASGGTRAEVMAEAKAIQAALSEKGFQVGWEELGAGPITRRVGKPHIIQVGQVSDGELMSKLVHGDPAAVAAKQSRLRFHFAPRTPGRMLSGSMPTRVSFAIRPLTEKEIKDKIFGSLLEHENYIAESMLRKKYLTSEIGRLSGIRPGVVANAPLWRLETDLGGEFPIAGENISKYISDLAGRPPPEGSFSRMVDKITLDTIGIPASSITRSVNDAMFNLTLLWGDVIFPAMNVASIVQTLMPEISYVGRAPVNDLMMDYSTALIRGSQIGAYQHFDPLKFTMRALRRIIKPDAGDRKALSWAVDHMVVAPRLVEEFVGEVSEKAGLSALRKGDVGFLEWFRNANRFFAVRSEEFARLNAYMSGLQAAEKYFGLEGEKAYLFAKQLTERTMFNYGAADRAALITGPVGTLFGLFKNWTMHYLANLWGYSKQGFQHGDFVPLLWAMAGTGAIGGTAAAPGYFAIDTFSKFVNEKDAMTAAYEAYGDDTGQNRLLDLMFYGVPGMFGLSLAQRANAPGADPLRDVNSLTSLALLDRLSSLKEFGEAATDQFLTTGQLPGQSRRTFDLFMRAAAPRTIYRFKQVASDHALRSLKTGNMLVDDLDYIDRLSFGLGAPTTVLQKALDVDSELWRRQDVLRDKTNTLGEAYSEVMMLAPKDLTARARLLQRAIVEGVGPDAMLRSAVARYNNSRQQTVERQFKDYQTRKLRQITRGELQP